MFTAVLVATSCAALPGTDRHTGVALPQFGLVYDTLTRSGWRVVTASPAGGAVPVDAGSWSEEWAAVTGQLSDNVPLQDLDDSNADAWVVFGGHGALFDLPEEPCLARLLARAVVHDRPVVTVDHGSAALAALRMPDGVPVVAGMRVTGRSDAEERLIPHHRIRGTSTEQRLRAAGALFAAGPEWKPHIAVDWPLITAQNTASAPRAVSALLAATAEWQSAA